MAILRIQTTTAREGKTEDFNALVGEGAALMNSKGINTVVRVSHSGTDTIEVYTINFFENWTEYGKGMNMIMTDADMQAYYFKSITSWAAVPIDNSELVEVPGFEKGAETQGNISISTAWRPIAEKGKTGQFLKSCKEAMEIHEKYGAKVRLMSSLGGRCAGQYLYQMGFESFEQMGEAQDAMTEEFTEFNAKQPISADLVNQVVLRNSTIIS